MSLRKKSFLRSSKEQYRSLVQNLQVGVFRYSMSDMKVTQANPAAMRIFGFSSNKEVLEAPPEGFFINEWEMADITAKVISGETIRGRESLLRRKDGKTVWVSFSADAVFNKDGEIAYVDGIVEDITERKKAEEALLESEERYKTLFDQMITAFALCGIICDADGKPADALVIDVNPAFEKLVGMQRETVAGKRFKEVFDVIDPEIFTIYGNVALTGSTVREERHTEFLGKYFEISAFSPGKGLFAASFVDITEKKKAEEALREERNFVSAILDTTAALIVVLDSEGRIAHFNKKCEQTTGYASEEVSGRYIWDVIVPDIDAGSVKGVFKKLRIGNFPNSFENHWDTKDGRKRLISWSNTALTDSAGRVSFIIGTGIDVTEHRMAEEALKASEQRYRTTIDAISDMIHVVDSDLRIIMFNKALPVWEEMIGVDVDAEGRKLSEVFPFLPQEVHDEYAGVFESGEILITEESNVFDGRTIYTESRKIPIFEGEKVTRVITIVRDITERKTTEDEVKRYRERLEELVEERTRELRAAQDRLASAERLAMLGQFAGSISHELRNPLAVIAATVFYLERLNKDGDPKTLYHLEKIIKQVDNCTGIIESVLNLTRMEAPHLEQLDIVGFLRSIVSSEAVPPNIDIKWDTPPDPMPMRGDRGQLKMAFSNIVSNAVQAMPDGGVLRISMAQEGEGGLRMIDIRFADSGVGISAENIDRIFQPLFTTRKRGIGLGLAIVKMIAEKHGGAVFVESAPGIRTTFSFRLPADATLKG